MRRQLTAATTAVLIPVLVGAVPPAASAATTPVPVRASARQAAGVVDIVATLTDGGQAAGTGMVVTSFGDVLTNDHVISGAVSLTVTVVSTGRRYTASVLGYDSTHDVALLHLTGAVALRTVSVSRAGLRIHQTVVGVGNAGGVGGRPFAAAGTLTGGGRTILAVDPGTGRTETLTGLLEATSRIAPGDSGGPLENAAGGVVGMDTAGAPTGRGPGYAIPIMRALAIVSAIRAGRGSATIHIGAPALLGVEVGSPGPATVLAVLAGSAADHAGIVPGDVITSVAGLRVTSAASLSAAMRTLRAGSRAEVGWLDATGAPHLGPVTMGAGAVG